MSSAPYKIPESVLVVIYRENSQVLLLRRAVAAPGGEPFWQSVTGSKDFDDEDWRDTAIREVREETGIDALAEGCVLTDWNLENLYTIYPEWQHRYAPGVWHNRERVFGLQVPADLCVHLNPREHTAHEWHAWRDAAQRCFSSSNAEAILLLPRFATQSAAEPFAQS
ncbi:MAG: dihydroneopterin triphosphate diphosphatase [Comamonas sp.]